MLKKLKNLNPHIQIKETTSPEFKRYGRVVKGYDFKLLDEFMENSSTMPKEGNFYEASTCEMEGNLLHSSLQENFYANMDIQIGYCNGNNSTLNGLEYHKGSEINYAVTDMVLLLGHISDIEDNTYHSDRVEAFYVKKGQSIEMYQTTLHFAPCRVDDSGFKCVVILPRGTNTEPLKSKDTKDKENKLLFMKNKWLIVHPSKDNLIEKGAHAGINGENTEILYK